MPTIARHWRKAIVTLKRILTNIGSDRLEESRDFYVALLGFTVKYDSDWYVQLASSENTEFELGIIRRDHELVPSNHQTNPSGVYITLKSMGGLQDFLQSRQSLA